MPTEVLTAFDTALDGVQANITSMATTALPVILGIVGLVLAISFGIKFVKRFSK